MSPLIPSTRFSAQQHAQPVPAFGARKGKHRHFAGSFAPNTSLPVVTASPADTMPSAARKRLYWSV